MLLHLADTRGGIGPNTQRLLDAPTFRALPGRVFPMPDYYVAHYRRGDAVLTEPDRILGPLS